MAENNSDNEDSTVTFREQGTIRWIATQKSNHRFSSHLGKNRSIAALNEGTCRKTGFDKGKTHCNLTHGSSFRIVGAGSLAAEQNASIDKLTTPFLNFNIGLSKSFGSSFGSICSDVLKTTGATQSVLNSLSDNLINSACFGLSEQVAEAVSQFAAYQIKSISELVSAFETLSRAFYPSNLRKINDLNISNIQAAGMLDGICLYEVPRMEIAARLLRARNSRARRDILGQKWREIASDCHEMLELCRSTRLRSMISFANEAVSTLESGNSASAQSLAGCIVDTLIHQYLLTAHPLLLPKKDNRIAVSYQDLSLCEYIALSPIWQAYQTYYPGRGDRPPCTFNRHATAHTVGRKQYSRRNAVQGLMLACGILRLIDATANE